MLYLNSISQSLLKYYLLSSGLRNILLAVCTSDFLLGFRHLELRYSECKLVQIYDLASVGCMLFSLIAVDHFESKVNVITVELQTVNFLWICK